MSTSRAPCAYSIRKTGQPNTTGFSIYIEGDGKPISPFHDIPLYHDEDKQILNMVVEIPRWTNAKKEVLKDAFLNPIKQDINKDGKVRFVRNIFPYKGYIWNYGAIPQTWEDPGHIYPGPQARGDNDPLDVCEIGKYVGYTGQVKQVKILGAMCLLDEGETDWKIIAIDIKDPLSSKLNNIDDVEVYLPGLLQATNDWFRVYKVPDGKPLNSLAFAGGYHNKEFAIELIRECNVAWQNLMKGEIQRSDISLANTCVGKINATDSFKPSTYRADEDQVARLPCSEDSSPAPIDVDIDKWFFGPTL